MVWIGVNRVVIRSGGGGNWTDEYPFVGVRWLAASCRPSRKSMIINVMIIQLTRLCAVTQGGGAAHLHRHQHEEEIRYALD
jgi:Tfp pilus assembly protein PilN